MTDLFMPVAVDDSGGDPATFYATFDDKLTPLWSSDDGLEIWSSSDPGMSSIYAPIKTAMRYLPSGFVLDGLEITVNTLQLQTWPVSYTDLKETLGASVPSTITIENVDEASVRTAVDTILTAMGRTSTAVDTFMEGNGLLKIDPGTNIATAAVGVSPPEAAKPNYMKITMSDGFGADLNCVEFFSNAAEASGVDKALHPLLSQLDLDGWVEVLVVDSSGSPITGETYNLYLLDGTTRTGVTDADGKISETGITDDSCSLDIVNYPSFALVK